MSWYDFVRPVSILIQHFRVYINLVQGCRFAMVQGCMGAGAQGCRGAGAQGSQGCRGAHLQGFRCAGVQGCRGATETWVGLLCTNLVPACMKQM